MLSFQRFQKINTLFSQGKAQEALHELMHIQAKHIALHDTVDHLKKRIAELEDIILLSKTLYFDKNFYWLKFSNGTQGPFCPTCYQREGAFYRLEKNDDVFFCSYCGTEYLHTAKVVGEEQSTKSLCGLQVSDCTQEIRLNSTQTAKSAKVLSFNQKIS